MADTNSSDEDESILSKKPKKLIDYQRIELEKLMKDPTKEIEIPQTRKEDKKPKAFEPHEFVRNVMGASAGAGSGEFDIYRGCRRRQMLREEFLNEQHKKKIEHEEFEQKLQQNLKEAEERTSRKRAKRLKKKEKLKQKQFKEGNKNGNDNNEDEERKKEEEEEEEIDLNELNE